MLLLCCTTNQTGCKNGDEFRIDVETQQVGQHPYSFYPSLCCKYRDATFIFIEIQVEEKLCEVNRAIINEVDSVSLLTILTPLAETCGVLRKELRVLIIEPFMF